MVGRIAMSIEKKKIFFAVLGCTFGTAIGWMAMQTLWLLSFLSGPLQHLTFFFYALMTQVDISMLNRGWEASITCSRHFTWLFGSRALARYFIGLKEDQKW